MPHATVISERTRDNAIRLLSNAPEGYTVTFTRRITLASIKQRTMALMILDALKDGWRMSIGKRTRSQDQNDKMWAMLTDISLAKPEGRKCTPDDWKCLVMHACGHDVQFMEGLDGKPFPVGFRSSHLKVGEMSTLIEWIYAYGNDHGVEWSEQKQRIIKEKTG